MPRAQIMIIALTFVLFGALAATASAETDVTGSWFVFDRFFTQDGGPNGFITGVYNDITLEDAAGAFSGARTGDSTNQGPIVGNVTGSAVAFVLSRYDGTTLVYRGTVSDNGNVISGYSAFCTPPGPYSHALQQGTFVMSLPGATQPLPDASTTAPGQIALDLCSAPKPTGPDFRHPTSTALTCFRGATATDNATCEVTVTDNGAPQATPAGGVNFTVPDGQGALPDGANCGLRAISTAVGSPSTCQITYQPPPGGLDTTANVPIQANYIGDANFKPSSVDHGTSQVSPPPPPSTIAPAPPPTFTLPQCQDGLYGTDEQSILGCSLLASAAVAQGGGWVAQSLAAALQQLDSSSRFVHHSHLFIATPDGWQAVNAQMSPWTTSQTTAYTTALKDPPAPGYTKLAKATPPKLPLIRVSGSAKTRATTRTLNTFVKGLATARGLSDAFTLTVNRAGGARAAKNSLWQGRQMRLAITLANALSAQDTKLIALATKVAALASTSSEARRGLSTATLQKIRARVARSGLTRTQRARLKKLGYTTAQIAAVVVAAKDKSVPTSALPTTPAKALADPRLVTELRTFALYFKLWAIRPEVAAAAALKR